MANEERLAAPSRWHQPHSWLTVAGAGIAFLSLLVAAGFTRGYLGITLTYFESYARGESAIPSAALVTVVSVAIPVAASVTAAALLLSKKYRSGAPVALAAVGAWLMMDLAYVGLLWDGHHVVYAYTHAAWFPALYHGYGSYGSDLAFSFYFLYVPALLGVAASLLIGWKKTKSL